jgi:protoporphyrinogen oxidase
MLAFKLNNGMEGGCCTPDLLDETGAPRALRASLASLSRSSGKTRLSERRYTTESADLETVEEGNRSEDFESKEKEFSLSKIVKPTPPRPKEKPPSILRLPVLRPAENKGHHRTRSHHRQKSIYFSAETSYDQMIEELQEKENIDPMPSSKRSTPTSSHCSPQSTPRIPKKVHTRTISDADSVVYTGPADEVPQHLLQDSLEVQAIKPLHSRQSNNSTVHNSGQDDPNLSGFLTAAIESFQPTSRTLPILGTL